MKQFIYKRILHSFIEGGGTFFSSFFFDINLLYSSMRLGGVIKFQFMSSAGRPEMTCLQACKKVFGLYSCELHCHSHIALLCLPIERGTPAQRYTDKYPCTWVTVSSTRRIHSQKWRPVSLFTTSNQSHTRKIPARRVLTMRAIANSMCEQNTECV